MTTKFDRWIPGTINPIKRIHEIQKDEKGEKKKKREIPILKRSGDGGGKGKGKVSTLSISSREPAGENDRHDQEDALHYPQPGGEKSNWEKKKERKI